MGVARMGWPSVGVVTGASAGLGRMFALALASGGTAVAIVARREAELDETAALVRAEGVRCEAIVGDVTEPGLAVRAIAQAEDALGPVEVLVANAAVLGLGAVAEMDPADWRRTIEVNLIAPMIWNQAASLSCDRVGAAESSTSQVSDR